MATDAVLETQSLTDLRNSIVIREEQSDSAPGKPGRIFLEHVTTKDPHHQKQPIREFWEKGEWVLVLEPLCDLHDFRWIYSLQAAIEDGGSVLEG